MKYSEHRKEEITDWYDVLDNIHAQENRSITGHVLRASSWVTCACGNQCKDVPRKDNGEPVDNKLYDLGLNFLHNIRSIQDCIFRGRRKEQIDYAIKAAKVTLFEIEVRSGEVLQEMKNNKLS